MITTVALSYVAPDIETLCAAIQAVRALGLVPTVSATTPPRVSVGKAPGASEPNVDAYLKGRQEVGFPATIFRVWKSEKMRGLSREQAAAERMTVDGWQNAQGPQGEGAEGLNVADTMPEDEPLPPDYSAF